MLVHALLFHDVVVALLGERRGAPREERDPPGPARSAPVILRESPPHPFASSPVILSAAKDLPFWSICSFQLRAGSERSEGSAPVASMLAFQLRAGSERNEGSAL